MGIGGFPLRVREDKFVLPVTDGTYFRTLRLVAERG